MELVRTASTSGEAEYLVRQAQERAMAGDHATAVNYLVKAIAAHPLYSEAYALLGNCQECLDRLDDAISSYDKALRIDPGHADAWFNKGMTLKKKGMQKEAAQCIEKSVNLYYGR
jgi:tetratricopeptide (TPR) repeat protein